jgi:hypothetical protein
MDHADFTGTRPNVFRDNTIVSTVPPMVHSSKDLKLQGNTYWYTGMGIPTWNYGGEVSMAAPGSAEKIADPRVERLLVAPPPTSQVVNVPEGLKHRGNHWLLAQFVDPASGDSRSNAVWLQTAMAQYGGRNLDGAIICAQACENLLHDWHLTGVQMVVGKGTGMVLISPEGKVAAKWDGFVPPAEIGFAVRWHVGGWRPPKR